MLILMLFAFLAGFATVISPCVLPVLPAILSVSAGRGRLRPYGVIIGLIISFVFFTLALTTLVRSFGLSGNVLRYVAILIIGFFGLIMVLPTFSELFARATQRVAQLGEDFQSKTRPEGAGFWSGLFLGTALGLIWTPCAGPILAAITALVATQKVSFAVVLLTLSYSIGSAVPLLAITLAGKKALTSFPFFVSHGEGIRQGFGVVMILTAVAIAFNLDVAFQQKVLDVLPNLQIENNAYVENRLKSLRPANPNFPSPGPGPFGEDSVAAVTDQQLPMYAAAPNFVGITDWINSPPLTMEQLKGKVILVDFWTYSCINCIRTLPFLKNWYSKYNKDGFVVIGIHTPEFEFEKDLGNVKDAVKRFEITYPVALDNNYGTWEAYSNSYWPAHYLIDQNGIIRQFHFGEGGDLETENGIRSLLGLSMMKEPSMKTEIVTAVAETPETYLGNKRGNSYTSENKIKSNTTVRYTYKEALGTDKVGLKGEWEVKDEYIISQSNESTLTLNFMANRVYLVLGGASSLPVTVELDDKPVTLQNKTADMNQKGEIYVKEPRKYDIIDMKGAGGRHVVTLHVPKGIQVYAFTFGMEK